MYTIINHYNSVHWQNVWSLSIYTVTDHIRDLEHIKVHWFHVKYVWFHEGILGTLKKLGNRFYFPLKGWENLAYLQKKKKMINYIHLMILLMNEIKSILLSWWHILHDKDFKFKNTIIRFFSSTFQLLYTLYEWFIIFHF